jgi:molybdopterin-guanine dinucleotide biosynthesis protein A
MGGVQKALLRAPDTGESLIARLLRIGRRAGYDVVLLGAAELGDAVSGVPQLPDAADIGPLAALQSLLAYAGERDALCLACDMPFVTGDLLAKLANESGALADVVAARDEASGKWETMFARYRSAAVAPVLERALADGERSFQGLFKRLTIRELPLDPSERAQLRDWDTPEDMRAQR